MREAVRRIVSGDVAQKTGHVPSVSDDNYVVPQGRTLRIASVSGGYEHSTSEVRIEYWAAGSLLAVGYASGATFQLSLGADVLGGETVTIRRVNGDPNPLHMTGGWEGVLL